MSHLFEPRHRAVPPPRRLLAIGGAGVVTLLTIGGALGLGPGAAMGETNQPGNGAHTSISQTEDSDSSEPSASAADDSSSDGGWLTIDDAPKSAEESHNGAEPAIPAQSGQGRRVVFDMSDQRVWLVDASGDVARTYPVSGSLHDNLQPGTYTVYSKSADAVSFDHKETMKYMVRFAHGPNAAIGFHDVPRYADGSLAQSKADLGKPQSAGCIRQWADDAKALWKFTDVDTEVVVTA